MSGDFRTTAPLEIGDKNLGTPFEGRLDDLRIYNRTLSDSEVEDLAIRLPARSLLMALDGRPAQEIAALQPEKPPEEVQIGEEDKAETKEEKEKALEKDRQTRLTEYFLKYARAGKRTPTLRATEGSAKGKGQAGRSDSHGHDHGRDEKAARNVCARPRPVRQPQGESHGGRAGFSAPHGAGLADEPARPREVDRESWQSAHGARGGESFLAGIFRHRNCQDLGRLRIAGRAVPSHPLLLDWLATEFVRTGWNVKAMQRLIVTSATYRQSSRVTPELEERDPENRLLARGPRFRLPAELIRDNALAVSGLLDDRIGGPSVYPYQPKGLWEEMAFGEGYTGQTYTESTGRDLYRRSMYTVWKRTVPPAGAGHLRRA